MLKKYPSKSRFIAGITTFVVYAILANKAAEQVGNFLLVVILFVSIWLLWESWTSSTYYAKRKAR